MLIYMIPFILLLGIAIVLKKREANKQAEQTPTAKVKAKKVSSTKKTAQKTQIVESSPPVEEKKPTTLSMDQRNQLKNLIRERNFFSAEAQINQALNKDNSQHELYLLLLEIHLLQKDEFAANQLINQLRSLELDDCLEQALAQKAAHDQKPLSSPDSSVFKPEVAVTASSEKNNSHDFDQLMTPSAAPVVANTSSFEQLQQEALTAKTELSDEIKPLEFNSFAFNQNTLEKQPEAIPANVEIEDVKPLEFDTLSFTSNPIATAESEAIPANIEVEDVKPLEFDTLSFTSNPITTTAPEPIAVAEEIKPLDFSFSLDTPVVEQPTAIPDTATHTDTAPSLDQKPEFEFDFVTPTALSPVEEKVVVAETQPLLDFNFTLEPNLATTSEEQPFVTVTIETPAVNFDIQPHSSSAQQTDAHDPLVQSFPELVNVNEINLNLELAAQYIQLGTFESARELLQEQAVKYSAEQQQKADQLRNQIAS